ncbi:hypothetical protein [Bacterioplanoides pacificum]|uniref:GNAT family acetyltransferase n=1 Tax=Bacterioplanoides pacificum TaxID=1171596 RepID=A0ABV7VUE3_9GAMM
MPRLDDYTIRSAFARLFAAVFMALTLALVFSLFSDIWQELTSGTELMQVFLGSINTGIIALAVFELALVIHKEYSVREEEDDVVASLRRTVPRFIGTVCVALSLEGLIMVIKYSQLDLAGNLYYPVAIISSTALLLLALGVFIYLTQSRDHCTKN